MYPGFSVSNILESVYSSNNILYYPHYSLFDVAMSDLDLSLYCIDGNAKDFFDKNLSIIRLDENSLPYKSYSIFLTNNPLMSIKNNITSSMHLNSIMLCHDTKILGLKKEDLFLICNNTLRTNDCLYYFPNPVENFVCPKILSSKIQYSIPEQLSVINNPLDRTEIAILSYNKHIENDYLKNLANIESVTVKTIPKDISSVNDILNKYKIVVELDPGSIINVLWAIACGCVGIIMDVNDSLLQYKNIPNLHIANSVQEMVHLLQQNPSYIDQPIQSNLYVNHNEFKNQMLSIIQTYAKKAFVL